MCMQGQRAGEAPSDAGMFPHVWETAGGWKKPAFTDMCSSYTSTLPPADATDLSTYGGYFEAGSEPPPSWNLSHCTWG